MSDPEKKSLTLEILEQISKLATSGFGLVAALAWNEAIQNVFRAIFPQPQGKVIVSFLYAVFITAIVVIVTIRLGDLIDTAKKKIKHS